MNKKPTIIYSSVTLEKLAKYFDFDIIYSDKKFKDWFGFKYNLLEEEKTMLDNLIQKHRLKLPAYLEEKLKVKFITPILNKVDFFTGELDDWYEMTIGHEFDNVVLSGATDYIVATGTKVPKIPYFFLQEFKPSKPSGDPEIQLLAQLITALAINQQNSIKGGYIVGQLWYFSILEKEGDKYKYYVSRNFDALSFKKLYQIYNILQAVKSEALGLCKNP